MAKVKFSALVAEMRNKLNGSVFSRNRGGAYLRNKVTPTNPRSIAQVQARNLLTQFSQAWRTLTQAQRDSWSSVVSQWAKTDIFGDIVNPSGNTLYNRLNINIAIAGGSPIDSAPAPQGVAPISELSVVADEGDQSILLTFATTPIPADTALLVEASPMCSPGISNANSKFRVITVLAEGDATGADIGPAYAAKYGALVADQKLFVRAKFINMLTGETSQLLSSSTVVVD